MNADVIRAAVGVLAQATEGVQEEVTYRAFRAASDEAGGATHEDPVFLQALVLRKEGVLQTGGGKERRFRASISFQGRGPERINTRDIFTLRDGVTGPILTPQGGLVDPATGQPFNQTIYLG